MTNEEITWIRAAQRGDRESFSNLVRQYDRRLTALIQRYIPDPFQVEDIYQEVFLLAWRQVERFQFQSDFFTWLFRIGVNQCLNAVKRNKSLRNRKEPDLWDESGARKELIDASQNLEKEQFERAFREHLQRELAKLPMKQEMAFQLKYFQDLRIREIALIMSTSESAVKTMLFRAGRVLRKTMEAYR